MTSDGHNQPPTISTIADDVGVSVATVSKVLNGRADVAAETRARVEASLDRHRYLRRRRRHPVGAGQVDLVFHVFDSEWAMEIIRGVEAYLSSAGVQLVLSQLRGAHRPPQEWLDGVLGRRPVGLLFVICGPSAEQQEQLRRQRIPFVVIDQDSATEAWVPTVGCNNWNGGLLAANHLLELGHQRTAVISGSEGLLCSRHRVAGFEFAHRERGVPIDPDFILYGNFWVDAGYELGMRLLSRKDRPTAIFAGSDMQALGVLRAARRLGLDVPRDLSVIGYDNLPVARWSDPELTTVNQPLGDMARTAARMLLDLARGLELSTHRVDLVTELVTRQTTAPPP